MLRANVYVKKDKRYKNDFLASRFVVMFLNTDVVCLGRETSHDQLADTWLTRPLKSLGGCIGEGS